MKQILALSGSGSSKSINKRLLQHAASLVDGEVELISVLDYPAPIFTVDVEAADGIPASITALAAKLDAADGLLIATPEHNGHVPTILKNTIDWLSRTGRRPFISPAPTVLMATSPGGLGGSINLGHLSKVMPYWGTDLVGTFSLPKFNQSFGEGGITDAEKASELAALMATFSARVSP